MTPQTAAEAQAEVERRLALIAVRKKAESMSKGQRSLLQRIDQYHPGGFSSSDLVQGRTLGILHARLGFLDVEHVPWRKLETGGYVEGYDLYTINDAGRAALETLGLRQPSTR